MVPETRRRYKLDFDWRFHLGDDVTSAKEKECEDSKWREVDLPHDFVVEGKFTPSESKPHGYLPFGVGWYRKHFTVPEEHRGESLWLEFDGVQKVAEVWLNGVLLGSHNTGYTSFVYDLTGNPAVVFGRENVLAVRLMGTNLMGGGTTEAAFTATCGWRL
jgi:beta-galactosidase